MPQPALVHCKCNTVSLPADVTMQPSGGKGDPAPNKISPITLASPTMPEPRESSPAQNPLIMTTELRNRASSWHKKAHSANAMPGKDMAAIAEVVSKLDRNNDGVIEPLEIYHVLRDFAERDAARNASMRIMKWVTFIFAVLLTLGMIANCVFMFLVVDGYSKFSVNGDGIISRSTGTALHVDPASFTVRENLNATGGANRRSDGSSGGSVLVDSQGSVVSAAPLLDKDGALLSAKGKPVSTTPFKIETDAGAFGGLAALFDMEPAARDSIEKITFHDGETEMQFTVAGFDYQEKWLYEDDRIYTPQEGDQQEQVVFTKAFFQFQFRTGYRQYPFLLVMQYMVFDGTPAQVEVDRRHVHRLVSAAQLKTFNLHMHRFYVFCVVFVFLVFFRVFFCFFFVSSLVLFVFCFPFFCLGFVCAVCACFRSFLNLHMHSHPQGAQSGDGNGNSDSPTANSLVAAKKLRSMDPQFCCSWIRAICWPCREIEKLINKVRDLGRDVERGLKAVSHTLLPVKSGRRRGDALLRNGPTGGFASGCKGGYRRLERRLEQRLGGSVWWVQSGGGPLGADGSDWRRWPSPKTEGEGSYPFPPPLQGWGPLGSWVFNLGGGSVEPPKTGRV